ncbi:hypothetical protein J1N35_031196 [Gossypium stocksii]|uniref:Uncharacterized protein n=1 Tax=Gossypium stocksii TaxID=47602 RepID=A0A9D3V252_9ROSI|nr:hypothetical protein J1N35_031196 [Gossypium stocksii]
MENDSLLPENDALVSIPPPLTPFEFKDRLIFGPSPASFPSPIESSPIIDSFSSSLTTLQDPLLPQQNQLHSAAPSCATDPNFPWEKTNLHRSKTAPAIAVLNDVIHPTIPKPQFGSPSIVREAFVLRYCVCHWVLSYIGLIVLILWVMKLIRLLMRCIFVSSQYAQSDMGISLLIA